MDQNIKMNTSLNNISLLEISENSQNDSGIDIKSNNTTLNDEENFNEPVTGRRIYSIGRIGRSSTIADESADGFISQIGRQKISNFKRSLSVQVDDDESQVAVDADVLLNRSAVTPFHSNNAKNNNNNSNVINNNVVKSTTKSCKIKTCSLPPSPISKTSFSKDISNSLSECSRRRSMLLRDSSLQSDSSYCSSVDSLLEARKPDPEAILINLGFGPVEPDNILTRIPKRFLKPSQVHGIDTEEFLRKQQLASHLHDHSVLGYRGLLGNPDIPPSSIVAKIMERFELNERSRLLNDYMIHRPISDTDPPYPSTDND